MTIDLMGDRALFIPNRMWCEEHDDGGAGQGIRVEVCQAVRRWYAAASWNAAANQPVDSVHEIVSSTGT